MAPYELSYDRLGHEMVGVGLQGDGTVGGPGSEQDPGHDQVDDRRPGREQHTEADLLDFAGIDEPRQGAGDDADRREDDQGPFGPAGEILRLAVSIGVLFIRRPRCATRSGAPTSSMTWGSCRT